MDLRNSPYIKKNQIINKFTLILGKLLLLFYTVENSNNIVKLKLYLWDSF